MLDVTQEDFVPMGRISSSAEAGIDQYVVQRVGFNDPQADRGFTLKVMGKKKVFDSKRSKKVMSEIALLGALTPSVWTPTLLAAFSDKRHLFSVFDKVLAAEMVSIVDGPMPEAATKFFIGSVALGLSHIHT